MGHQFSDSDSVALSYSRSRSPLAKTIPSVLALTAALVVVSGCAGDSVQNTAPYDPPDQPGSWLVGTDKAEIQGQGVELPLQIWYPAEPLPEDRGGQDSAPLEPYVYNGLFPGGAYGGGTPACPSPRPVVLFSHGSRSFRWQSAYLAEHLASRGYLVAAPDHVLNMFGDDHLPLAPSALRRPQDIKDSFEWLLAQSQDQASDLYGCVDADQGYAVVGHSFGGYTALVLGGAAVVRTDVEERCAAGWKVACGVRDLWPTGGPTPDRLSLADDRVWAAIVLAPWDGDVLGSGLAEVAIPVTVIGAELDTVTPWDSVVRPIYDQLPEGNRYLAEILKSGHGSFIGVCSLAGELEGCGAGYRPADEVNEFTQTATVNFFDVVRGVSGAEAYWPPAYRDVNWQ